MTEAIAQPPGALPDAGRLGEWPLPRILLALSLRRFDGRVSIGSGRHEKRLTFEQGAPVLAESSLASEALGSQLVDKGVLDREDYQRVCDYVNQKGCREGVAMLALELIGPKDLFLALKDQVRRRVVDCFGWPDGEFQIEPGEPRGEDAQAFRCDPIALTQEGLETHWSIERMLEGLTPWLEKYPAPRKRFAAALRRLELGPDHASRLGALSGEHTLGMALGPLFSAPRAVAAVWILDALGCLEYSDAPVADPHAERAFDSEIEIAIGADEAAADAAATSPKPSVARPTATATDGEAAAMRAQIEKLLSSMEDMDHYSVLGVEPDARGGAIKKAYFKAAKQYHPDTLARLGLDDVREDASEVFARIAEAYEVVNDAARRKDYDAAQRGELTEQDAVRLAQAETSYRKGEILLRMGDFAGALEYLAPAVEIWPEECAYQSALGWALFKQPQSDPGAARAHLVQAVRLGPEDAPAHQRLGMVLRALGETAEAEKMIALAGRLDPEIG